VAAVQLVAEIAQEGVDLLGGVATHRPGEDAIVEIARVEASGAHPDLP
jgi:hypothetical protein